MGAMNSNAFLGYAAALTFVAAAFVLGSFPDAVGRVGDYFTIAGLAIGVVAVGVGLVGIIAKAIEVGHRSSV